MNMIGGAFYIIPIVAYIFMAVVYIFMAVVAWRFMRAHESIAESARIIAENLKKGPQER